MFEWLFRFFFLIESVRCVLFHSTINQEKKSREKGSCRKEGTAEELNPLANANKQQTALCIAPKRYLHNSQSPSGSFKKHLVNGANVSGHYLSPFALLLR